MPARYTPAGAAPGTPPPATRTAPALLESHLYANDFLDALPETLEARVGQCC